VTARALRVLGEVSLIAAEDTRRTAHLLSRYAISTPTTSLHEHNEARKASSLITRLQAGEDIALVSDAGTPLISDPGQHLIRLAIDAGIRVEPIPGPSAIVAALTVSGFATQPFVFLGFPPTRSKDRKQWLSDLVAAKSTAVFFEAPHRIRRTLEEILTQFGDFSIVVCRELTKIHEELVRGPISKVLETLSLETGELTIVVDVGHKPASYHPVALSDEEMAAELGDITKRLNIPRRRAIQRLAKKHGRQPNEVYAAVERARRLAK
jgi:16S rRNA (cytidine1402-2'-O)-methyltransferase